MNATIASDLEQFAAEKGISGLTAHTLKAIQDGKPGFTVDKAKEFLKFQQRINNELLNHRVIVDNTFCKWWNEGKLNKEQVKAFVVQFSVFSNLFIVAQLKKTLNADTLEGMHASKEILMNELGVIFNEKGKHVVDTRDVEVDPELVSTEGTIEGGIFRHRAAHFEWLLRMAEKLGLKFQDIGKAKHGTKGTIFFCDELSRLYASADYTMATAASYAVENWAAAGFWKELVNGFRKYNEASEDNLPLAFFTWHDKVEDQHAAHTQEELEEEFFERPIDQDAFLKFGNEMLDGVWAFWQGLDEQRKALA